MVLARNIAMFLDLKAVRLPVWSIIFRECMAAEMMRGLDR